MTVRRSTAAFRIDSTKWKEVLLSIYDVIREQNNYSREGYPRGGAIDRLRLYMFWNGDRASSTQNACRISLYHTGHRLRYFVVGGNCVQQVLSYAGFRLGNGFLLVTAPAAFGETKYGSENTRLASFEAGIIIQALHYNLCVKGIDNCISNGIRVSTLDSWIRILEPDEISISIVF